MQIGQQRPSRFTREQDRQLENLGKPDQACDSSAGKVLPNAESDCLRHFVRKFIVVSSHVGVAISASPKDVGDLREGVEDEQGTNRSIGICIVNSHTKTESANDAENEKNVPLIGLLQSH